MIFAIKNKLQLQFTNFILQNNVSLVTNRNEIFSCNKNLIQIESKLNKIKNKQYFLLKGLNFGIKHPLKIVCVHI